MTGPQLHEVQDTAGEMLRSRRREKQLSVQEISAKLHLDEKIIESLEENDFDSLPAATYVRGYLRSYAKLVAADADLIISLYDNYAPEPPEIIPDVRYSSQISSSDKPVKAITWLICLILMLLLISWIQSKYQLKLDENDTAGAVLPEGSMATPADDLTEPDVKSITEEEFSPYMLSTRDEDEKLSNIGIFPGHEGPVATGEPDQAAGFEGIGLFAMPGEETAATMETATADLSSAVPAETVARDTAAGIGTVEPPPGTDSIYLKLTADSWIEIYDRFGNKLYLDLARTGQEIALTGVAPFEVKLGFSQGVIMEFNGEPFDPAPYSRAGVARFQLGK